LKASFLRPSKHSTDHIHKRNRPQLFLARSRT